MSKKINTLLAPLSWVKYEYSILFLTQIYHGLQSIFTVQIAAFIVAALQAKDLNELYFWTGVFVVIRLLVLVGIYFGEWWHAVVSNKVINLLNVHYLRKFIRLDNNKIESLWTGKANSIMMRWVTEWWQMIVDDFTNISVSILSIGYAFWVILFTLGWQYFLLVLGVFAIMSAIAYYFNIIWIALRVKRRDLETEYDRSIIKIIMSKFEILQNNKFSAEESKLDTASRNIVDTECHEQTFNARGIMAISAISASMKIFVFCVIGVGVINNWYALSYFVLLAGLIDVIDRHIWTTRWLLRTIMLRITHVNKLLETFETIPEIQGLSNTTAFVHKKSDIEFKNMNFAYHSQMIFKDFNLRIQGGKKTAFVGDSGSGKTTLMKLIAGYLHPISGDILIDDQKISDINLLSYYEHVGYLTQDPSIFDGSIRENLMYALDHEVAESQIKEIIALARCEFIYELANGLDTEIGERGIKLSGGQRQRLAIAKIMLKNPDIILLDEPTSALDSISEQAVSEALHNLFQGKTVIVIAHRLQTVKEADEIIVLKQGEIIERWNHETLSQIEGGEYRKMLDLQTSF